MSQQQQARTTPPTATCLNCGDTYLNALGRCSRCNAQCIGGPNQLSSDIQQFGTATMAQNAPRLPVVAAPVPKPLPSPALAPASTPAEFRVTLPNTYATSAWLVQTNALIAQYERDLGALDERMAQAARDRDARMVAVKNLSARVDALRDTRAELATAISALKSIPRQLHVSEAPVADDVKLARVGIRKINGNSGLRPGQWSKQYSCCIDCGTTQTKHVAKGRCARCDASFRKGSHPAKRSVA